MTPRQINLIKTSWQAAATNPQAVGQLFYGRLFEIAPDVRPMFNRATIDEQSKKLLATISFVISKLDKLEDIIDEVAKLARRHVTYGVMPEHYAAVGAALLWTLEQGLGDQWNDELKEAWTTCYTILSGAMISASEYTTQDAA
jgi:hemoglobin-like flavoprotein